jgi:poly(3-hydroxybutyrate) depolymerase
MIRYFKKKHTLLFLMVLIFCGFSNSSFSQEDHSHYSESFKREKPYRIFLPDDYTNSQKRYPVIYYFHGNTGSHKLNYEGVTKLVNDNEVILVAWNGRSIDSNIRPYNIGNHSNIKYQIQFKDYFLEFINHIDST